MSVREGATVALAGTEVSGRMVPPPGAAPLRFPTAAAMLRHNGTAADTSGRDAVRSAAGTWTHAELWREIRRTAATFANWRPTEAAIPFHIGVLADNSPDYLAAIGAAALTGATLVGLNPTRVGPELARDVKHTDVLAILTQPNYAELLSAAGVDVPLIASPTGAGEPPAFDDPTADPEVGRTWLLVLTSGTSSAPKAVICSQRRMLVTGERMRILLDVGPEDVGYLCMPLFHSNALMVGLMPAWLAGATVAVAPRFSARGWLPDVRQHGVTYWNYTGKPLAYLLATEERPDDADNPVRRAYGNEGSDTVVADFSRRFGVSVIDGFGPTEGGIGIMRTPDDPPGSLGHGADKVLVVDEEGRALPRARFDSGGRLLDPESCVGEIVNTAGPGPFEGYYNNVEATERATRGGWYWTGDLGYLDAAGYVYFAGRAADWIRVDGENFPAGPIESALARHPDVVAAAAFGVPDPDSGDAVMGALVLAPGATFDPAAFAAWLDEQPDLAPKWRPTWLRVTAELPRTPTHKVLHRRLQRDKFRLDLVGPDHIWQRDRRDGGFTRHNKGREDKLRERFVATGRDRFWDL